MDIQFRLGTVDDAGMIPSLPLGFLGVQLAHLLRRMSTIQNPKKP